MNKRLFYRLLIDFLLFTLVLLLMAYPITDYHIHELLGSTFIILLITHNVLNRWWYKSLFKGKYHLVRILHTAVNLLLLGLILFNFISALGISLWLFTFLPFDWGFSGRTVHIVSAYWGIILLSMHIGLHWDKLMSIAKKASRISPSNPILIRLLRLLVAIIAIYGMYASWKQAIGAKLLGYYAYSFWDGSQSIIVFFIDYFTFMALCIAITYYGVKRLRDIQTNHLQKNKRF